MGANLNGAGQEASGSFPASSRLATPAQGTLFTAPRPEWRLFLHWLIGRDLKGFSARIYPQADPDHAADNVTRILEGRHKRHFDVGWIDLVVEHFGSDGAEALVRFVCERFGYEMPAKKANPVRVQEELAAVRKAVDGAANVLRDATAALERVEGRR